MATESLTYAEIAIRLGVSTQAARALARRLRLPRQISNDRKAVVLIDFAEIQHKPQPAPGRPDGDHVAVAVLQERVATLAAELSAERDRSATHRADYERERERGDQLAATLAALRVLVDAAATRPRPWWRWWWANGPAEKND